VYFAISQPKTLFSLAILAILAILVLLVLLVIVAIYIFPQSIASAVKHRRFQDCYIAFVEIPFRNYNNHQALNHIQGVLNVIKLAFHSNSFIKKSAASEKQWKKKKERTNF